MCRNFFTREQGQGLTEYALVLLLIALVVISSVTAFGLQLEATYNTVVSSWP